MITTAGLAALGAATFGPSFAQDAMINQKPWNIGATLRGFYDDNYFTYPKQLRNAAGFDDDTFGFDVSPSVGLNLKNEQTTFGLSYLYDFRYYIDRPRPRDDQSHQANAKLSHAFSERFSIDVKESFVVAQEPAVLDPSISVTFPARAEGDNIRNYGSIQLNAAVMDNFKVLVGYANTFYDYQQNARNVRSAANPLGVGSWSSVLDRDEHLIYIDGAYQILPQTQVSLGYQYGKIDYTSKDPIFLIGGVPVPGSIRDNDSHFVTVGVNQHISPTMDASAKVGIQYTQYESPLYKDNTSPYAEGSFRWAYYEGSSMQLGVKHARIATDVRAVAGSPIADQEATSVYVSVNHAITGKITAAAMVQYQHSDYDNGGASAADEILFGSVTLGYQFTPQISAEVGYSYDRLDSDLALRSYSRNRVFVGTRLNF